MIPAREYKVANETFVSIDNEVSTKFFWLFVFIYQLGRGESAQITSDRLESWFVFRTFDIEDELGWNPTYPNHDRY